jgi:hypothetical protein
MYFEQTIIILTEFSEAVNESPLSVRQKRNINITTKIIIGKILIHVITAAVISGAGYHVIH